MLYNALPARRPSSTSTISPTRRGTAIPRLFTMIGLCAFLTSLSFSQVNVLTQNADEARDAVYSNETTLTPTSKIHKLFTMTLDSPVRGQALIVSGVAGGPQNILLATTSPNHTTGATSAFGFNADTGAKLWQLSLGSSAAFSTATPVVDPGLGPHGALFVVIKDSGSNTNKLHAIDVLTGTELAGSPITITATSGGSTFNSPQENARTALLDINGTIYTSFCHMTDSGTYHGWLIGYKYTTGSGFTQNGVWCDTCAGGNQGGIWQGGDGLIFDGTSIFAATGNGSMGGGNFGMSVVKLNPANIGTVQASFVPAGAAAHSSSDQDLNGGGMVLMPGTGGKIFIGPTKYGSVYLIDSTNLGRGALSTFGAGAAVGHSPIAWDSGTAQYGYIWSSGNALQQYCYNPSTGNFGGGACHTSSFSGGGTLAISSDPSGGNAILWAFGGSELHAMNPANVSAADYWNSNMNTGDSIGSPGGFQYLAIANGKVYAPTGSTIVAYGETQTTCTPPSAPSGLSATAISSGQVNLSWTASTSSCSGVTYDVFRSTTSGFTPSSSNQIANGLSGTTFSDTTVQPSTTYFYLVEGVDPGGTSPASNQASAVTPAGNPTAVEINAGGPAVSPFTADADFSGGRTINHANTIDLTHATNPAPMAVYQTSRIATTTTNGVTTFTYTFTGFGAATPHQVRLHFAETFWTAPGKRTFNVAINGTTVLSRFDIFATAGAANRANIQQFSATADSSGSIVITFTSVIDNALISGIEIH
jgi:Malectin domain